MNNEEIIEDLAMKLAGSYQGKLKQIGWYSVKYHTFHFQEHGPNDIPAYIKESDENSRNEGNAT